MYVFNIHIRSLSKISEQITDYNCMLEDQKLKEILLKQGKVTLVDDEDYEELCKYRWSAVPMSNGIYAMVTISIHNLIMKCPEGMEVDHIDGNGLNNRKENLKIVTTRQNQQNQQNRKHKKLSQYPGVTWSKPHKRWYAQIRIKKGENSRSIGFFSDELEAATAYRIACAVLIK